MWNPFVKKPEPEKPKPSEWVLAQQRVHALYNWRKVGETFDYHGKSMVVATLFRYKYVGRFGVELVPEVMARYCDNHGVMHELRLHEDEVLALIEATTTE